MSGHEQERLSAFLDGELPEGERAEVAAHLAACGECRGLLAALDEVDRAVVAPGDLPAPTDLPAGYFDGFAARVRGRIEAEGKPARGPRRLPAWGWALAAALLLAVVTPLTIDRHPAPGPVAEKSAPAPASAPAPSAPSAAPGARPANDVPVADHAVRDRQAVQRRPGAALPARTPPAVTRDFAPPPVPPPAPAPAAGTAEAKGEPAAPAPAEERALAKAEAQAARPAPAAAAAGELSALQADAPEGRAAAPKQAGGAAGLAMAGGAARNAEAGGAIGARSDALAAPPDLEFRRLDAVRPASRAAWLALRERWRAFADAFPGSEQADEARVQVVACGLEALRAGGGDDVRAVLRRDAGEYLARKDARQKPRVRALLEAAASR